VLDRAMRMRWNRARAHLLLVGLLLVGGLAVVTRAEAMDQFYQQALGSATTFTFNIYVPRGQACMSLIVNMPACTAASEMVVTNQFLYMVPTDSGLVPLSVNARLAPTSTLATVFVAGQGCTMQLNWNPTYGTESLRFAFTRVGTAARTVNVWLSDDTTGEWQNDVVPGAPPTPLASSCSNCLTDGQLRASNVGVSGPLTDAQLRASNVAVSGPLTDAQLRATDVGVMGDWLTDAQLRATPVETAAGGGPGGATEITLSDGDQARLDLVWLGVFLAVGTGLGIWAGRLVDNELKGWGAGW